MRYNRQLAQAIMWDRIKPAKAVNTKVRAGRRAGGRGCGCSASHPSPAPCRQVISLEDAPKGYADFDKGMSVKFLIDPHGMVKARK